MILTANPFRPRDSYLPAIPSPLSPRSANIVHGSASYTCPRSHHALTACHSSFMSSSHPTTPRAFQQQIADSQNQEPSPPIESNSLAPSIAQPQPSSQTPSPTPTTNFSSSSFSSTSSIFKTTTTPPLPRSTTQPFSTRPIKQPPAAHTSSALLQTRRRTNFLGNVRTKREDKRFESRGEDMLRWEFLKEKREREEALKREGEREDWFWEEEEVVVEDVPMSSAGLFSLAAGSQRLREVMGEGGGDVDEVVRREEEELEAMLENLPVGGQDQQSEGEHPWSDDDDYDALFSELMSSQQQREQIRGGSMQNDEDAMDLS